MSRGHGQGRNTKHLGMTAGDMSWQTDDDAPPACRVPTDIPEADAVAAHRMFDSAGPGRLTETAWTRIRAAIAICAGCPVRDACLAYAVDPRHRVEGVWGGFYFSAVEARGRISLDGARIPASPPPPPRPPRRRTRARTAA